MKRFYYVILLMSVVIAGIGCASTKSVGTEEEQLALKQLIESGEYKIEATMAYPRRGRSVPLTSSYSVEIKNDSVFSYLPFYGRAYTIPYGGGNGLNFNAPVQDYSVKYNKGAAEIKFNAQTSEDLYRYTLNVYPDGTSNIDVVMQQRESMRYSGRLEK